MKFISAAFFVGIVACMGVVMTQGMALAEQTGGIGTFAVSASPGDVLAQTAEGSVYTVSRRGGHRGKHGWRGGNRHGWRGSGWRGRGWYGYSDPWRYGGFSPSYRWSNRGLRLRCYDDEWGDTICRWVPRRRY